MTSILTSARQAWLRDQFDDALDLFREARSLAPQDVRLAIEVASYLAMRFEVSEAVKILNQCEQRVVGHGAALHQLGIAYRRAHRDQEAFRCYEAAVKLDYQPAKYDSIEWHERRGELAEATSIVKHCPSTDLKAHLWRGRLAFRRGDLGEAMSELQTAASNAQSAAPEAIASLYELAAVYDQQDEIEKAIGTIETAKQRQLPQLKPHLARAKSLAAIERNFVTTASRERFEKWQPESHRSLALLSGPPRSGTSLMTRMLSMHPKVAVADELEAYSTYLQPKMLAGQRGTDAGEILDALPLDHLQTCRHTYERWITEALGKDIRDSALIDKFPSTTFLIPVFRRLFPNATIIMALRDPRDVVLSCYLREFAINPVSAMFGRIDWTVARCCAEWTAWLRLRDVLPQPWVEVRYEHIVDGDYRELGGVLKTFDLQWQDEFADFQATLGTAPARSPTYAQLRSPITKQRVGRWERYAAILDPHRKALDAIASQLGYPS